MQHGGAWRMVQSLAPLRKVGLERAVLLKGSLGGHRQWQKLRGMALPIELRRWLATALQA